LPSTAVEETIKTRLKRGQALLSWSKAHSEREHTHSRLCHSPGFSAKTIQMTKPLIKDQIGLEIKVFIKILLLKLLDTRHSAYTV
jgi:hypothetical protein